MSSFISPNLRHLVSHLVSRDFHPIDRYIEDDLRKSQNEPRDEYGVKVINIFYRQEFQSCLSDAEVDGTVSEQQIRDCFAPIYNTGTGTGSDDTSTTSTDSPPSDDDTSDADDTGSIDDDEESGGAE